MTWDNIHISDADIARDDAHLCVEKVLWRVREDTLNVLGTEEIIKVFPRTMYLENASTVIVLKTPKTESSVRKVWMPKTVAYILREWKASQDKQKAFLGDEYLDYGLVRKRLSITPSGGSRKRPIFPMLFSIPSGTAARPTS